MHVSLLAQGVASTDRSVADPALDTVSGRYFDFLRGARSDPQSYDVEARRALRAATEQCPGP